MLEVLSLFSSPKPIPSHLHLIPFGLILTTASPLETLRLTLHLPRSVWMSIRLMNEELSKQGVSICPYFCRAHEATTFNVRHARMGVFPNGFCQLLGISVEMLGRRLQAWKMSPHRSYTQSVSTTPSNIHFTIVTFSHQHCPLCNESCSIHSFLHNYTVVVFQ